MVKADRTGGRKEKGDRILGERLWRIHGKNTKHITSKGRISFQNNNCVFMTKCPSYRERESEVKTKSRSGSYTSGYASSRGRSLVSTQSDVDKTVRCGVILDRIG